ncbi:G-protein-signaling modulator 2 [Eumeta japonica]|uniref:G-protein-signaling modulator 2 n=1 Tax=Eumeta variegata TaxID=151549 RepID=A0A4C1Y210_EUMVA|nr:G-protein-signaling modulator 2 [Eumeta japonica]
MFDIFTTVDLSIYGFNFNRIGARVPEREGLDRQTVRRPDGWIDVQQSDPTKVPFFLLSSNETTLETISDFQTDSRTDSQTAMIEVVPKETKGSSLPGPRGAHQTTSATLEDDFLDMIARVQGSRFEEQRSDPPPRQSTSKTLPDEDFFSMLMRVQAGRMDDQRATIPIKGNRQNNKK